MEENNKPSQRIEPVTEKPFNPNRAQRRAGVKAFVKTDVKRARALAANHPPKVIDRRKRMASIRHGNESTHAALP